uniref:Pco071948b n=1 Tax=Arundo donax TaxID=35708 RepID=A0A0A9E5A3_ARUDO
MSMHGLKLTAAQTTARPPDAPHFAGRAEAREPGRQTRGAHRGDGTLAAHLDAILRLR